MLTRARFRRTTIENRSSNPYGAMTWIELSGRRVSPTIAFMIEPSGATTSEFLSHPAGITTASAPMAPPSERLDPHHRRHHTQAHIFLMTICRGER